jgi:hypothetical protein
MAMCSTTISFIIVPSIDIISLSSCQIQFPFPSTGNLYSFCYPRVMHLCLVDFLF